MATRRRLIDAAVDCLHRTGFAATTTLAVAKAAGVSRGAMLHQFPTRASLLLAVAERITVDQDRARRDRLMQLPRGEERFEAVTMAVWETMREPASIALLEIMMGARSDPELAPAIAELMRSLRGRLEAGPVSIARDMGVEDDALVVTMTRLHLAAMRGLALERLLDDGPGVADEEMRLLQWYKGVFSDRLLGRPLQNRLD